MPSKDSKTPEKDDAKVVKFKAQDGTRDAVAKKKGGITLTQIVTYVILGLLAIVLVVGVFPSFGSQGNSSSIKFGAYNGKDIEFSYGNYFYRQYQTQAQQNSGSGEMAAYQIWRSAFESTVFHTAVSEMAKKVGIRVVGETLNKAIIDSGAYNKDGKFDVATYERASIESKNQLKTQFEDNLPVQMVMEDVTSVLSASDELAYIQEIGDTARSFSYVVFDSSVYPDELAQQYARANPADFTMIDVSIVTADTLELAQQLRDSIAAGEAAFEDVAQSNSIDAFAVDGGRAGVKYLYELESSFANPEEVNILFSSQKGALTEVFEATVGAVFFRVEQEPFLPDFTDSEVITDVKSYIGNYNPELISSYVEQEAQVFASSASTTEDFAQAAENAGLSVVDVEATPVNVGESNYLIGFSYTDSLGYLRRLSSDTEMLKSLYTIPVGSVSDPLGGEGVYIVARVNEESGMDEEMREYLSLIYPYMTQSQSQQDLVQSIFTSEKFEDNFLIAFLDNIMETN
jgi:parvulin-like peptidyl-prolyl isomerase